MTYSGEHTDKNGMSRTFERAVGQGCFILGHVQLSQTVNSTLNEVMIMKLSSINRSSQLEVILTKRNSYCCVLYDDDKRM